MSKSQELASVEKHPRVARIRRFIFRPFWQRVYNITGQNWLGINVPPLTERKLLEYDIHEDKSQWDNRAYSIATLIEDGHEVWFGYHNKWKWHIDRKVFNKIVRNYIWVMVWHNWFGLRNWLYCKALHKIVEKRKRLATKSNGGNTE